MGERRRGTRSGRGWDAAPAAAEDGQSRPARRSPRRAGSGAGAEGDAVGGAEQAKADRDPAQQARDICLRQLAVRPRTRAELATVLQRRGIADEVAAQVLDRYAEVGMIDDAAFASAWVNSRHHGKGLARRSLANELRRRGVDSESADAALDEIDDDTEAATARALADRKLRTMTGDPASVFRRVLGMLARKGYPAGVAVRATKEALAARDQQWDEIVDETDWSAIDEAPH